MIQDSLIIEKRHKRFIKTVCESETIYGLKNNKGFATSSSVNYENDEGQAIGTEFDRNMFGFESEPMELILELITELKSIRKDLKFKKFEGIIDLEKQVKEIVE